MANQFRSIHLDHEIPDLTRPFQITCPPGTDMWDKPPSTHSANAPLIYRTTTVSGFKSAKVTISAAWKDQYDQGGLCLIIKSPDGTRWVKTGIELLGGQPNVSVVATDRWSDWSLRPLLDDLSRNATVEMESASDGSLWVWLLGHNGKRSPMREVTWWKAVDPNSECWIGAYAAKPAPHGEKGDLIVRFEGLEIQTA